VQRAISRGPQSIRPLAYIVERNIKDTEASGQDDIRADIGKLACDEASN
jgi:hypothetical protein